MPRGKKTSIKQRSRWLREYDETGKSLEQIAKEGGRAISTVSKGIERARAEEDIKRVKIQQLGDAYQLHTSDLLYTARVIQNVKSTIMARGPEPLGVLGHEMLLEGLRSHIRSSPLWRAVRERENHFRRMTGLRLGLNPKISAAIDEALSLSPLVRRHGFRQSLHYVVDEVIGGGSIESAKYGIVDRQKYWQAVPISDESDDIDALGEVEKIHHRVLLELAHEVPVGEFAEAKEERERAQRVIDEEVEMLTLRRIIPGECNLCPRF